MQFNELPAKQSSGVGEVAADGRKARGAGIFFASAHLRNDYFSRPGGDSVMVVNQALRIVKMENSTASAHRFAAFMTRM